MLIPGWIMMAISFKGTHRQDACIQTKTNHQNVGDQVALRFIFFISFQKRAEIQILLSGLKLP
jgi:hypothetical protein